MKKLLKSKYIIIFVIILLFVMISIINPFSKSEEITNLESAENLGTQNVASVSMEINENEQITNEAEEELQEAQVPVALAETNNTVQTFEGEGTSSNPYKISTKAEMFLLAEVVNNYTEDSVNGGYYTTKYYELTSDIDLENEEWTPIGTKLDMTSDTTNKNNYTFQGNFNGNGHTIRNVKITVTSIPSYKARYGLFGSLYSTSSTNRAMVYNLEIDGENINIATSGTCNTDMMFGIVAGHIGKNSSIINCIAKNSTISIGSGFTLGSGILLSIGGIVGDAAPDATADASSYTEITGDAMYVLENCFANVDITVDDGSWASGSSNNTYYQYNIGGIVGRIRAEAKLPQNCIYTGKINATKAFIGPIYGCARYNTANSSNTYYMHTYLGLNSSSSSIGGMENGYFYNYKIINGTGEYNFGSDYKETLTKVELGGITGYAIGDSYMGKVQGVNRGEYLAGLTNGKIILNSYNEVGVDSKYKLWYYDASNDTLTFKEIDETITIDLIGNGKYEYTVQINGDTKGKEISYEWYIDDENNIIQSGTSNTITITDKELTTRKLGVKLILDGNVVATKTTDIDAETLDMQIRAKKEQGKTVLYVECNSSFGVTTADYNYIWYKQNAETLEFEIIEGVTGPECEITTENGITYKVEAIHKDNAEYNKNMEYIYGSVIYVNNTGVTVNGNTYEAGNDSNNGKSPDTAVKTIEAAYDLLIDENTAQENIIVLMGSYQEWVLETTFNKPATITGIYSGVDYAGTLKLFNETSIFLNAETIFENITFDGGNSGRYIYCRGNSLTMSEGVKMTNFSDVSSAAWATPTTNYPALTIVGGWINYKAETEVPKDTCNITIKSGYYARILAGGRTGTNNYEGTGEGTSDIFGTLTSPYKIKITIDIQNNTESDKIYDGDIGLLVGGQADGSCYISNEINLKNGKVGCLVGGNLGYGRTSDEMPTDSFFGSTTLNLSGGEIDELYGGSLGRNKATAYYYGKIDINITGTLVNDNVYGTGAGGTTGYLDSSTDKYKNYAQGNSMQDLNGTSFNLENTKVEINIGENAKIKGSIYGAGYGYSKYLSSSQIASDGGALYGDTSINITGGTIEGNIYGGGRGTDTYGTTRNKLACVVGNINVNISGTPTIKGSIYGGSEGIESVAESETETAKDYSGMAKVTGNINVSIDINSDISGNVFGGGSIAETTGNVEINISNGTTITGDIYGGGKGTQATVYGVTKINIDSSNIHGNIFGGGDAGDVVSGTEVIIHGGTNVTQAVYGGGNNANVGTEENFNNGVTADSNVTIYDANIGEISEGGSISGGEVFGGGNYGKVYGNTIATVGSAQEGVFTNVGLQFYAGGRGDASDTSNFTVYRKLNWYNSWKQYRS